MTAVECWLGHFVSLSTRLSSGVVLPNIFNSLEILCLENVAETSDVRSWGIIVYEHILNEGIFTTNVCFVYWYPVGVWFYFIFLLWAK